MVLIDGGMIITGSDQRRRLMKKIKRNAAQCRKCGDIIESKSRTQVVRCSCGAIFIEGGKHYLKRGFKDSKDDLIELVEYEEV